MIIKQIFYNRHTIQVAQNLLGCFLVREYKGKIIKAKIIETEAYRGEDDLACHASKGRTKRTETLYSQPGTAYVYIIYGMYFMLNVVTEKENFPAAVLIRGVEGYEGPGKLTKFFHINKSLNGHDLTLGKKLWLEPSAQKIPKTSIVAGRRIGVDYAKHCKDWKWNFKIN